MISSSARPYIDASVPVLREHGLAITQAFYSRMFETHPELRHVFNMGNQASGIQQQSLAAAVFAYAAHIDHPAALAPVVERIVHKHASVGILPGHYPIVGHHLLGAIAEILGDAASPELLAAWHEAYWLLAGTLISAEARLSERSGSALGAMQTVRIMERHRESVDIDSFYLQTLNGQSPGRFLPGQYISVAVTFPEDKLRQMRQYSLSDAPDQSWWRISVKRVDATDTPAGRVSNWLHAHTRAGDLLQVSHPYGEFALAPDTDAPIALLSAGVGITPMLSMLNTVATRAPRRSVLFAHAAQGPQFQAFTSELQAASRAMPNLKLHLFHEYGAQNLIPEIGVHPGRMDLSTLAESLTSDMQVYLCGPSGFMQAQRDALISTGFAAENIHREVFGPELLEHLL